MSIPVEMTEDFGAIAVGFLVLFLLVYLIFFGVAVLMYVFHALSLHSVAKRRGILNPWLAWIPIGDMWIMGSISDQYQYLVKGKIRKRRYVLLGIGIAIFAGCILFTVSALLMPIFLDTVPVVPTVIFTFVFLALVILIWVYFYMAQYDFYRSCDPGNAVAFLVVGIFFDFLQPIFQFACRRKDLGMITENYPETND